MHRELRFRFMFLQFIYFFSAFSDARDDLESYVVEPESDHILNYSVEYDYDDEIDREFDLVWHRIRIMSFQSRCLKKKKKVILYKDM